MFIFRFNCDKFVDSFFAKELKSGKILTPTILFIADNVNKKKFQSGLFNCIVQLNNLRWN